MQTRGNALHSQAGGGGGALGCLLSRQLAVPIAFPPLHSRRPTKAAACAPLFPVLAPAQSRPTRQHSSARKHSAMAECPAAPQARKTRCGLDFTRGLHSIQQFIEELWGGGVHNPLTARHPSRANAPRSPSATRAPRGLLWSHAPHRPLQPRALSGRACAPWPPSLVGRLGGWEVTWGLA